MLYYIVGGTEEQFEEAKKQRNLSKNTYMHVTSVEEYKLLVSNGVPGYRFFFLTSLDQFLGRIVKYGSS